MNASAITRNLLLNFKKVGYYDEGDFIRLDNITIKTFVENYLRFIEYDFGKDLPLNKNINSLLFNWLFMLQIVKLYLGNPLFYNLTTFAA